MAVTRYSPDSKLEDSQVQRKWQMNPKWMFIVGGIWFLVEGTSIYFFGMVYEFMTYGFGVFCISMGILCLLSRNEAPSRLRNSVLTTCFLSALGVSLNAYYAQWSGTFLDTFIGYITPTLWLIVAIGFFLARRARPLPKVRNLQ